MARKPTASSNRPLIYWDTCVFMALVKGNEPQHEAYMAGIRAVAEATKRRENTIITSTITIEEMFESKMTEAEKALFHRVFDRPNVKKISFDGPMAIRSQQLREIFPRRPKICAVDARHLATAIHYGAEQFHTLDRKDKKDCVGLLELNGKIPGSPPMTIMLPDVYGRPLTLFDRLPSGA